MAIRKSSAPPAAPAPPRREDEAYLVRVPASQLRPWTRLNPRRHFDPAKHQELVDSVRERGVKQPILVHDNSAAPAPGLDADHRFWIVAGERRYRAALEVGPDTLVPCMVSEYSEDLALEIALIENLDRDDLSAIEEARGYQRLLELPGMTQRKLAERIGREQPTISNAIRLLQLPDELLQLIDEGILTPSHARDYLVPFARIPEAKRTELYARAAKELRDDFEDQGPYRGQDVREMVAAIAQELSRSLATASWDKNAPRFDPAVHGACSCNGPRFQYGWSEHTAEVRCFDDAWWDATQAAAIARDEAQDQERKARLAQVATAGEAPPPAPTLEMTGEQLRQKYGWDGFTRLELTTDAGSASGAHRLLDPAELTGAEMVIAKDTVGGRYVVCVDQEAVRRARTAAGRERNRRLKVLKGERAERYLSEASGLEVEPWMLGEILSNRPQNDQLLDVSREVGIDIGKHGQVHENLKQLPAEQVTTLFKVLALRGRAGELSWLDPLEQKVDRELVREYTPALRALSDRVLRARDAQAEKPAEGDVGSKAAPVQLPGGGWGFRARGSWSTAKTPEGPFAKVKRASRITDLDDWAGEGCPAPAAAPVVDREPKERPFWLGSGKGWEYTGRRADGLVTYCRRVLKEGEDRWQTAWGQEDGGPPAGYGEVFRPYDGPADRKQFTWSQLDLYVDGDPAKGFVGAGPRDLDGGNDANATAEPVAHTIGQDLDAGEAVAAAVRELQEAYDAATMDDSPETIRILSAKLTNVRAVMEAHQIESGTDVEEDLIEAAEELLEEIGDSVEGECRCVVCGCTDSHACQGGCSWTLAYTDEGIGVCDACEQDSVAARRLLDRHRRGEDASAGAAELDEEEAAD